MRYLGTVWSTLSNGYHGNHDRYKNFDFSFGYVFPCSITTKLLPLISRGKVTNDQNFQILCF